MRHLRESRAISVDGVELDRAAHIVAKDNLGAIRGVVGKPRQKIRRWEMGYLFQARAIRLDRVELPRTAEMCHKCDAPVRSGIGCPSRGARQERDQSQRQQRRFHENLSSISHKPSLRNVRAPARRFTQLQLPSEELIRRSQVF